VSVRPGRVWRVHPWDPDAPAGAPFSPQYVPAGQGGGRFDLPGLPAGVLYLAETPEHAVAERIQQYRGQPLEDVDLFGARRRLALVAVTLPDDAREGVADLCDPQVLLRLGARADDTASRHRLTTQRIAANVHQRKHTGLRWWSAFFGDWHAVVIFRDRVKAGLVYGTPEPLTLDHPALHDAASALGVRIGRPARRRTRRT
jgi:hypothetical protein